MYRFRKGGNVNTDTLLEVHVKRCEEGPRSVSSLNYSKKSMNLTYVGLHVGHVIVTRATRPAAESTT